MKCNIWIPNTSDILESFHDNQLYFAIKFKRTFLTKYVKLQVPSILFCYSGTHFFFPLLFLVPLCPFSTVDMILKLLSRKV